MMSLKKFFMEGLIQVAILLSLCRVQEEVGLELYLPSSLQEILLGHTSALTPTQSHQLHHHGLHPKTVDLDSFFTARRLLGFGRSVDRLQVPQVELETWLVQRDPGPLTLPRGSPYQTSPLERPAAGTRGTHTPPPMEVQVGHVDQEEGEEEEEVQNISVVHHDGSVEHQGEDLNRRSSSEGGGGPGGSSGHMNPENQADQAAGSLQECLRLLEETFPFREEQVDASGGRREDLQGPSVDRSLSCPEDLETHWQDLLSIMEQESTDAEMKPLQHLDSGSSGSAEAVGSEDLMTETRDGNLLIRGLLNRHGVVDHPGERTLPLIPSAELDDHSSYLDSKASLTNNLFLSPPDHRDLLEEDSSQHFSSDLNAGNKSFNMGLLTADVMQLMELETPSEMEVNLYSHLQTPSGLDDEVDGLPLSDLFEKASMLEEMRLLDNSLEEGFSPEMTVRLEEGSFLQQELSSEETGSTGDHIGFIREERTPAEQQYQGIVTGADSDSGLSLDFSHSPASPCVSEASSNSSSSSSVSSSSSWMSAGGSPFTEYEDDEAEERGLDMELEMTIKQEDLEGEDEMGAVGGGYPGDTKELLPFKPENHKLFQDWMEHVDHDHTYNQPRTSVSPSPVLKMTKKHVKAEPTLHNTKPYHRSFSSRLSESRLWSRDERRARALRIPFSNDLIVNLPVEEFNDLLTKCHLDDDQMNLIKDIRRRGKNKIAAQNCRKRKQDVLLGLEDEVSGLRRHRLKLLKEKEEAWRALQEMRQQLGALYQEVFSRLREDGENPLDTEEYLIEFEPDRTIMVASHQNQVPPTVGKSSRKQKDKKK